MTSKDIKCPPSFISIVTSSRYLSVTFCPLISSTTSPTRNPARCPEPPEVTFWKKKKEKKNLSPHLTKINQINILILSYFLVVSVLFTNCNSVSPPTWLMKVPGLWGTQPSLKPNPKGPFWREQSLDLHKPCISLCSNSFAVHVGDLFSLSFSSASSSQKSRGDRPNWRKSKGQNQKMLS